MKYRIDFVTNSSSSSFVVDKRGLSATQLKAIENHIDVAKKLDRLGRGNFGSYERDDEWYVRDGENNSIMLSTYMDNFDMREFLHTIGVSEDDIYDFADDIPDNKRETDENLLLDILNNIEEKENENNNVYDGWVF